MRTALVDVGKLLCEQSDNFKTTTNIIAKTSFSFLETVIVCSLTCKLSFFKLRGGWSVFIDAPRLHCNHWLGYTTINSESTKTNQHTKRIKLDVEYFWWIRQSSWLLHQFCKINHNSIQLGKWWIRSQYTFILTLNQFSAIFISNQQRLLEVLIFIGVPVCPHGDSSRRNNINGTSSSAAGFVFSCSVDPTQFTNFISFTVLPSSSTKSPP